jgi:hypothetical protein
MGKNDANFAGSFLGESNLNIESTQSEPAACRGMLAT